MRNNMTTYIGELYELKDSKYDIVNLRYLVRVNRYKILNYTRRAVPYVAVIVPVSISVDKNIPLIAESNKEEALSILQQEWKLYLNMQLKKLMRSWCHIMRVMKR